MEVVRVSSSITGKYPSSQISSKLNPHSAGLSTLKGKFLVNEPKIALVFPTFTAPHMITHSTSFIGSISIPGLDRM